MRGKLIHVPGKENLKVRSSHRLATAWLMFAAFLLVVLPSVSVRNGAFAQQPPGSAAEDRERGIKLYQLGDATAAIEALREAVKKTKDDGDAWHYLGLAVLLKGDKAEARKSFEKAATIRLNDLAANWPALIVSAEKPNASGLKTGDRYKAVIDSFERYLEVTPNATDWKAQLESLRFYYDYYNGTRNDEMIISTKQATSRLRILKKQEPDFSGTRASGTSVLRAVFASDGTVKHILVLRRVAPDFDLACIEAARLIEFTPAIKDGHAVSMILQLEYNRYFL